MSLTSARSDGYWRIESNDDAWVVTAAFAMPAWQYRQLLSVVVRQTLQITNFLLCQWAPELDPHALLIRNQRVEAIICWNKEAGAVAVLVPTELGDEERQYATRVACELLAFAYSLIGSTLQPLSAFVVDDEENDSWVTNAVVGDLRLY